MACLEDDVRCECVVEYSKAWELTYDVDHTIVGLPCTNEFDIRNLLQELERISILVDFVTLRYETDWFAKCRASVDCVASFDCCDSARYENSVVEIHRLLDDRVVQICLSENLVDCSLLGNVCTYLCPCSFSCHMITSCLILGSWEPVVVFTVPIL